jgi:PGF-pre-PGF domain-containing protein
MGSGVSQEATENIAAKELATDNIISGYHIKYNFKENATPITYIEYDAKRTFRKTTSIAEVLVNKSSLVPELPYGKVYRHVNVWVGQQGAGLPTSIANGFVGFKVERAWMRDNSINETFVTLQWYDREWQPLETEKIGEDEIYIYFKAKTPGYSSFAITEFTPEDAKRAEIEGTGQIQRALQSLSDNKVLHANMQRQVLSQKAMKTAKIIMALSLPLFMLAVGYCIFKKKI